MKEVNLGPVFNPDGTASDLTKEMLAGTGRLLYVNCPACGYELCFMDRAFLDECTMCGTALPEAIKENDQFQTTL